MRRDVMKLSVLFSKLEYRVKPIFVIATIVALLPAFGFSQGTLVYTDIWAEQLSDGDTVRIRTVGVTDDLHHGVQHEAIVQTTLYGPNGTPVAEGVGSGYHSVSVNLIAVEGTYSATSSHRTGCGGFLGTSVSSEIRIGYRLYTGRNTGSQVVPGVYNLCSYVPGCIGGMTPSCGPNLTYITGWQTPCPMPYATWRLLSAQIAGASLQCFKMGGPDFTSPSPGPCQ